jgi:hypothetical protein
MFSRYWLASQPQSTRSIATIAKQGVLARGERRRRLKSQLGIIAHDDYLHDPDLRQG